MANCARSVATGRGGGHSAAPLSALAVVHLGSVAQQTITVSAHQVNDITALSRMLKVLRLARAGPLIARLSSKSTMHSSYITALEFFLYVIVCAHVLACLFYMIPILFECEHVTETDDGLVITDFTHTCMPTSWRTNYGLNDANNVRTLDPLDQYISGECATAFLPLPFVSTALIFPLFFSAFVLPDEAVVIAAFYWSLTTMTTIGYGDRGPGNSPEIVFTLVAEILGLSFFALLLLQVRRESCLILPCLWPPIEVTADC